MDGAAGPEVLFRPFLPLQFHPFRPFLWQMPSTSKTHNTFSNEREKSTFFLGGGVFF